MQLSNSSFQYGFVINKLFPIIDHYKINRTLQVILGALQLKLALKWLNGL
jgi:hypothetical protein